METKNRIMITNKNTACGSELMVSHSEYVLGVAVSGVVSLVCRALDGEWVPLATVAHLSVRRIVHSLLAYDAHVLDARQTSAAHGS
jgi:hypothetical protein